jgi:hypothetical protein
MSCNCECHDHEEDWDIHERRIVMSWISKLFGIPREINNIRVQNELLSQDQYAKAHLGEVMRLEDRITSSLKTFDEIILGINDRLEKIEKGISK